MIFFIFIRLSQQFLLQDALSAPVFNGYEKKRGTVCHTAIEGRRKTRKYKYDNSPRRTRRTIMQSCTFLKISYVINYKTSITLHNYLKNKVLRSKPRAKIGKEWKMRQKMLRIFLERKTKTITN